MPSTETESLDSHKKYRNLKRKLKALIYENECFQEELKKAQRKLLKVSRDKSFLLDRLLKYEIVESSSSDSEATASSDSDSEIKGEPFAVKKKKTTVAVENQETSSACSTNVNPCAEAKKKKNRKTWPIKSGSQPNVPNMVMEPLVVSHGDGHMTSEEIERHLEAKQTLHDLMPEKAPLTVPVEMFSNEPSGSEKCHVIRKPDVCKPGLTESIRPGSEERGGPALQIHYMEN